MYKDSDQNNDYCYGDYEADIMMMILMMMLIHSSMGFCTNATHYEYIP